MPRYIIVWEYAGEIVAAVLIYLLLIIVFGAAPVSHWVFVKRSELSTAVTFACGLGAAVFAGFLAILCTSFGEQLRLAGEAKSFAAGFGSPIIIFLTTLLGVVFAPGDRNGWWLRTVSILLIYTAVNCLTMLMNMIDVIRLWLDVDRTRPVDRPSLLEKRGQH